MGKFNVNTNFYDARDSDDPENDYEYDINYNKDKNNNIMIGGNLDENADKICDCNYDDCDCEFNRNFRDNIFNHKFQSNNQNSSDIMIEIFKCILRDSSTIRSADHNVDANVKKRNVRRKQQRSRIVQNIISSSDMNNGPTMVRQNKRITLKINCNQMTDLDFNLQNDSFQIKQEYDSDYQHHDDTFDIDNDNELLDEEEDEDDDEYEDFVQNDTSDENYSDIEGNKIKLIKKVFVSLIYIFEIAEII